MTAAELLDLVLPQRCIGCGEAGALLCADCVPPQRVDVQVGRLGVVAAAPYAGALRRAVLAYKERGRRDLANPLARLLARAVQDLLAMLAGPSWPVLLVPVPSSRSATAGRDGDHLRRLTRRAAVAAGVRFAPGVLVHTRSVRDSAGLGVDDRAANMSGALRARAGPAGQRVCAAVLVDDIVTTGATLREAHRALAVAGWPVLGAAVVAATPRRSAAPDAKRVDPLAGRVTRSNVNHT